MRVRSRRGAIVALAVTGALALAGCGGDSFGNDNTDSPEASATGPVSLSILIASSGDPETDAVKAAASAWATKTGNTVDVVAATDMQQQLAQGFASGNPPDLFYVDAGRFADLAKSGSLYAYADQIDSPDDFYGPLMQTFTYEDTQYCVPKDFSTLALEINTDAWTAAGLTDADIPTTWDQLQTVATKLTTGTQTGIAIGDTRDRIGAFMVEAGGWITNSDSTEITADSPANIEALTYVKGLLDAGVAKYPSQLDAGWSGEAFGTGKAAMTMEGNWIKGAMTADYPDINYKVVELPQGSAGKGTLQFTQCWGIADQTSAKSQAVDLVNYLTSVDQQLAFAKAFGVMPSRQSASAGYLEQFPDDAAFVAGGEYGQGPVNLPGFDSVLTDFDSQLQQLASGDPAQILSSLQTNAEAALQQ